MKLYTKCGAEFLVDSDIGEELQKLPFYLNRRTGYATVSLRPYFPVHRLVLSEVPAGYEVDHINRNKLDNRKENLRVVTKSQNTHNRAPRVDSKIYPGVTFWRGRYRAKIQVKGKIHWLGYFETKDAAIAARKEAENQYVK